MRISPLFISAILLAACGSSAPAGSPASTPASGAPAASDTLLHDVYVLSADDMEGRLVGSAGGAKARAFLLGRLQQIGVQPALPGGFEQPFSFQRSGATATGVNLLARVDGASNSDRVLVVMAHYDHVGVQNGQIYNGADDNASGTAALLAIAKSLKANAPQHDVILALVDGEEGGLRGARHFVANPPVPLDKIVLAVNFDMVSRSDKNEIYASGAFHFPWLRPRLEAIGAKAQVTLKFGHDDPALGKDNDWTTQSDHAAFHAAKVPWVYFGVEDHPDYHKPTDDYPAIPEDFFRKSAAMLESAVRAFDTDLAAIAADAGR
jgi:Zn-dependent M28 family amino/carboxypeptidase